jgi:hypothetical protein
VPIRAEYRTYYGPDWRRFRARLIETRGAWCRDCLRQIAKYINLCHETHDPVTSSIRIVCAACHARRDAPHRLAVRRRREAQRAGQGWLLPELEHAAAPAWAIPAAAFAGAQGELFQ